MQSSVSDVGVLFCKPHLVHFYQLNGWEHIDARTYLGTPAQPTHHPYQRMMQFLSDHGRQGHATFAQQPLYIESPCENRGAHSQATVRRRWMRAGRDGPLVQEAGACLQHAATYRPVGGR
jgi:hypothetical protein